MQTRQGGDEIGIIALAIGACGLDAGQHGPDGVEHGQQAAGDFRVEQQMAVAQTAQQTLADVADRFQFAEAEETARPLDGVDGAEDAGQSLPVLGILFQCHQVAVELVEVLVTFDQEFFDDIIEIAHNSHPPAYNPQGLALRESQNRMESLKFPAAGRRDLRACLLRGGTKRCPRAGERPGAPWAEPGPRAVPDPCPGPLWATTSES